MMEQLETGNIGIGNTSTLATLNTDRIAPMVGRGVPPSRLVIGNNCLKTTRLWRTG